ncbi:MAG: DUF2130 domain-containing protein [Sphingobacteriaceae bacterium]|nr:DUF2130 domain-containing protein [Sphingobacteriaceae bacterium]
MSNNSTVKCPKCGNDFEVAESMKAAIQDKLKKEAADWKLKKDEEFKKKEKELQNQLKDSLKKQKDFLEENIRKTLNSDFENKLKILQETNQEFENKLKLSRAKELEFLKKEQELKTKEQEFELEMQKQINAQRLVISEQIQKQEQEKNSLKLREYEKQLEDQKKLIEEMKKKSEQGSMQLQGEVQELALEDLLRESFPQDEIEEVAKGIKGADCTLFVKNSAGKTCGKIIYESKRTKNFAAEWIEKLKNDMRAQQADIAVIVSEVLPKDMNHFGFKDGVWICRFAEARALSFVLRESLIKIHSAMVTQENKSDKMSLLYNYLTGLEFRQNIEAIVEGFLAMKDSITREKLQMEKIWKEREKQLDKVLSNTTQFYGSVKGIAGNAIDDLKLLD